MTSEMTALENCPLCGGPLELTRQREPMSMGARSATVEVSRYRCKACHEQFLTPAQMTEAQRTLAAELRSQEDLLSPERIRQIRNHYDLTQAQMEQLLGTGPKTVIRWERGTVFQNKTADALLRALEAVPGVFEFLATRSGLHPSSFATVPASELHERTVRYVRRGTAERGSRPVVHMGDFLQRRKGRVTRLVPTHETVVPNIPEKALK